MSQWKFQISPNERNIIGPGYRMDKTALSFEKLVNNALSYPFNFHKINKLVLKLGPTEIITPEYHESPLGVAIKQIRNFSAENYLSLSEEEREGQLKSVTMESFHWLLENFDDANFVEKGLENLGWPRPNI